MTDLPEDLTFRAVEPSSWPDFERLFSSHGAPHYCWCLPYRATREEARQRNRATSKAGMARRICQGEPVGLLAYDGEDPIAWCSIAPRPTFPRLRTSSVTGAADPNDPSIWSLTCFYVPRRIRGRGLAQRLLRAAIDHARQHGAAAVEAYPTDPESPSYRYGGVRPMYSNAGFREIGRLGKRRYVMRLDLPVNADSP
ncbi:MAG: GNAT family N-acetyltransferase [Chloroflexota bacterium]|nr:GNAT family N-acetyltransferase [Chloroflexota bacterium]